VPALKAPLQGGGEGAPGSTAGEPGKGQKYPAAYPGVNGPKYNVKWNRGFAAFTRAVRAGEGGFYFCHSP